MMCSFLTQVGSVTFGLSCHFVGDSLAFAIILGLTSTLGAAIPLLLLHADEAKVSFIALNFSSSSFYGFTSA